MSEFGRNNVEKYAVLSGLWNVINPYPGELPRSHALRGNAYRKALPSIFVKVDCHMALMPACTQKRYPPLVDSPPQTTQGTSKK